MRSDINQFYLANEYGENIRSFYKYQYPKNELEINSIYIKIGCSYIFVFSDCEFHLLILRNVCEKGSTDLSFTNSIHQAVIEIAQINQ
jgi:hypothetical protein